MTPPAASPTPAPTAAPGPAAGPAAPTLRLQRLAAVPAARRRRRVGWLVAALALGAAAAVGWALLPHRAEVQVATVQTAWPAQRFAELTASGYVVAQRRAAVASKATGRLVELRVREGSVVKRDEVIARLDASDVQAAIETARAGVRQADAGARQAAAALQQARAAQEQAEAEWRRTQGLVAQGFVSPQAVDAARARERSAAAATAAAEAARAQAEAARAQAQAQLRQQQVAEDYTLIRAPFDGVVLVKNANVGDTITPFSSAAGTQGAVVTIADMATLEVEADVSESQIARIRVDQPVEIALDAFPDLRLRGSVARIVPTVDRAKATVMTKIRFDEPDPRILPEMSAKVTFLSQRPDDADRRPVTALSPKAIGDRDGRTLVFRVQGDRVQAVPVTPGRSLGDVVEVAGAVKPGDRIVLDPDPRLADGAQVAVMK